jgi:hypothetical protein
MFLSLPGGLIIRGVGDKKLCAAGFSAMAPGGLMPTHILSPAERPARFGVFYTCHFLLQATGSAVDCWLHDSAGAGAPVGFAAAMFVVPLPLLPVFECLVRRSVRVTASKLLDCRKTGRLSSRECTKLNASTRGDRGSGSQIRFSKIIALV